ncbi:quinon protein alcohol dehydrogenase-like superfamily [Xylariaceae sp. FL1651]|nr:quinon protein alcohol dehydrogenase-like superfamily [Xylariaceae sp. FL1651]
MVIKLPQLLLLGLLPVAISGLLPSKTSKANAERIRVVAAPAIPTSTLVSDFKKGNVSAKWAEGHPMVWGAEDAKFGFPFNPYNWYFCADASADEKLIAMANATDVGIVDLNTKQLITSFKPTYVGEIQDIVLRVAPNGGYHVLVSATNYTAQDGYIITNVHLSPEGSVIGDETQYLGSLATLGGRHSPFSNDGQRFLAQLEPSRGDDLTIIYDLDKPGSNITLEGHSNTITSSAFNPDGKLVSTTSWDGYDKVWDAVTGELVQTLGPSTGQNWITNFSPDGKYMLMTSAGRNPVVNIWPVANLTAAPIVINQFKNWIRDAAWTSDGKLLAIGEVGLIYVYSMDEQKIIQTWEMENRGLPDIVGLTWIESDSGLKLAYRATDGLEAYDFETNLKYRWGPDDLAQYNGAQSSEAMVIKSKGWIGGVDPDQTVRFWKFPV